MDLSDDGFEVLLQHLTPADTAALRLVSRSWQALVDRCLTTLQPFEVTTGFFSLNGTPCLTYRSPFRHSSVRHHPLEFGPSYALHAIAGQFTALHSLSVACGSKACGDFQALGLMKHLRQLHLAQFSFTDDAFEKGVGLCQSLVVLHLDSQQASLCMKSLRHLAGLSRLQELVLRPRGYTYESEDFAQGVSALGQMTGLTQLAMLTALKPPRHTISGESSALAGPMPDAFTGPGGAGVAGSEGQSPYLTAAATLKLSAAVGGLTNLKVLHLTGVAFLPPAVPRLTQLLELSLLRIGWVDRTAVASLRTLTQLTSLTLITAADAPEHLEDPLQHEQQQHAAQPMQQPQQHADAAHPHHPGAAAGAATAASATAAGGQGLWCQLLELPSLQQLVLGSAHLSQQLNLTAESTSSGGSGLQGCDSNSAGGSGGNSKRGPGMGSFGESCEPVSAYVCPTGAWSDISGIKGLQHMVVVRSWHSAAITAVFPSFAAAAAAFMTWSPAPPGQSSVALGQVTPAVPAGTAVPSTTPAHAALYERAVFPQHPMHAAAAAASAAVASAVGSAPQHPTHAAVAPPLLADPSQRAGPRFLIASAQKLPAARQPSTTAAAAGSGVVSAPTGSVGVFYNHPNQGCYIPALPQLLVLAFRPSAGCLGVQHKALVSQLVQLVARQQGGQAGSDRQQLTATQGLGGWGGNGSVARCLLLAQLRASMHHSRLLLVLGASATHLTRLELTVDQSWPPTVLASLGQLDRLQRLSVLKLDCGRQQPVDEMWEGLSRLVGLRWLCLRWLESLPMAHLAPLTNLVALQLKNIDKPPGVAQLAEVLHGMPHLTALAIEGALLDADEDWLRDMVGLMRHGRWTSSWVEHILCREYHLRVLGSITAALLMSTLLNSTRWPEMLASALLAAVAGAMFVMAVAASLLRLLLDPHQAQQRGTHQQQQQGIGRLAQGLVQDGAATAEGSLFGAASAAAAAAGAAVGVSGGQGVLGRWVWGIVGLWLAACGHVLRVAQYWILLLGGWLLNVAHYSRLLPRAYPTRIAPAGTVSTSDTIAAATGTSSSSGSGSAGGSGSDRSTWLSFVLQLAAVRASFAKGVAPSVQDTQGLGTAATPPATGPIDDTAAAAARSSSRRSSLHQAAAALLAGAAGAAGIASPDSTQHASSSSTTTTSTSSSITDPGNAFRRLRLLSLRRCTLTHSNSSVSNKLWQLSVLASQLAPGLGAQVVAVGLALVFWPLAVLAAISRIVATSGSFYSYGSSSGVIGSSGSSGGTTSGYSYSRRSRFAVWAWGWDLLCGLLQGAANRVEGVAAGCGPVVAVASCMPELRFLDLTWLNLEPWELHSIVQMRQLHYLGLSRQQVGVVMSPEAVFARNCTRGRGHTREFSHSCTAPATAAAAAATGGGGAAGQGTLQQESGVRGQGAAPVWGGCRRGLSSLVGWFLAPLWYFFFLPLVTPRFVWPVKGLWGGWKGSSRWQQQQQRRDGGGRVREPAVGVAGMELLGLFEEWPSLMLVESPSGFDEAIEREFAAM